MLSRSVLLFTLAFGVALVALVALVAGCAITPTNELVKPWQVTDKRIEAPYSYIEGFIDKYPIRREACEGINIREWDGMTRPCRKVMEAAIESYNRKLEYGDVPYAPSALSGRRTSDSGSYEDNSMMYGDPYMDSYFGAYDGVYDAMMLPPMGPAW